MKATKEQIRQKYSILTSQVIYNMYEPVGAYDVEWKKYLSNLNKVTKKTKKNDLEYTLQEMLLNYTR
jgi:Leu/Phe-tRNA-protein transferase